LVCVREIGVRGLDAHAWLPHGYRLRPGPVVCGRPGLTLLVELHRARVRTHRDVGDWRLVRPEAGESGWLDADVRVDQRTDAHRRAKRVLSSAERRPPAAGGDDRDRRSPR